MMDYQMPKPEDYEDHEVYLDQLEEWRYQQEIVDRDYYD